jgi:hypothetical protein
MGRNIWRWYQKNKNLCGGSTHFHTLRGPWPGGSLPPSLPSPPGRPHTDDPHAHGLACAMLQRSTGRQVTRSARVRLDTGPR